MNNQDEQWQQAWQSPDQMGMQKKQILLNSINDRIDNRRRHKKQLFFIGLSAAAAILVAVFIKMPGNSAAITANAWQELASAESSKKIMLEDGSVVWLAPHSTVKVYADFFKKRSTLLTRGTAFFSVAKDAQRPFTIGVNRQRVTVVGTAFTIHKLDSVDLQLTVKEGKVALNNPSGNLLLTAGQQVITTRAKSGVVNRIDPGTADWWLQHQLRLQNIKLEELLNRIETYYQVKLTYGTINKNKKVTLTWDLTISLQDNLTVLNTLTGYNIH
ncbi:MULTISPECIES: FecR family protein [Niastella]|uniref:FecR domain-containing protein n=1 Tax=Niastella soli TaxID=2821487 RepID=A0ABS3Z5T1_9BACT|nr:FecR domain-containing protein [Niastella soli]MBO9205393.1 FecR domain-containing protein [Niastella soli]